MRSSRIQDTEQIVKTEVITGIVFNFDCMRAWRITKDNDYRNLGLSVHVISDAVGNDKAYRCHLYA